MLNPIVPLSQRCRVLAAIVYGLCLLLAASAHSASPTQHGDVPSSPMLTLRKCVTAGGGVAYQSAPCTGAAREAWSREQPIEVAAPVAARAAVVRDVSRPRGSGAQRAVRGFNSRRQQCEAARQQAAAKRDREWNRLKFDDLSRLDAWVAERCR